MHESKGKYIGKAPSLYLFHTAVTQHVCELLVQANIPSYTYTETGSYSSFPGHVGGARKWPENETTVWSADCFNTQHH